MFEKVNPSHPDKIADRIAGAIVDLAYTKEENPKIAVEVLIGHSICTVNIESSVSVYLSEVEKIVYRITNTNNIVVRSYCNLQDSKLAANQADCIKAGDNGIFKGVPTNIEEQALVSIAKDIYNQYKSDGKYIRDSKSDTLIVCQSCAVTNDIKKQYATITNLIVNPLGEWIGGYNVDCGATNRKLGSDMGRACTGGGLHGKDLSKADVSVNIYAYLKAQATNTPVELFCAIGDTTIDGRPYSEIVDIAKTYINALGGFEKFAEWGLLR